MMLSSCIFSCHYSLFDVVAGKKMKLIVSEGLLLGGRNSGLEASEHIRFSSLENGKPCQGGNIKKGLGMRQKGIKMGQRR